MKEQLKCLIRKQLVASTPEELVRQRMLALMIEHLGYPESLLSVEQSLHQLPHIVQSDHPVPLRRADILCFGKGIHPQYPLYPLLLIECKATKINQKVLGQVAGYNHHVRAYFIAVANEEEMRTGWLKESAYHFVPGIPSFSELVKAVA